MYHPNLAGRNYSFPSDPAKSFRLFTSSFRSRGSLDPFATDINTNRLVSPRLALSISGPEVSKSKIALPSFDILPVVGEMIFFAHGT